MKRVLLIKSVQFLGLTKWDIYREPQEPEFSPCGGNSHSSSSSPEGCISSLPQPQLTADKPAALGHYGKMEEPHTWSIELPHGGGSGLVVDAV